MQYYIRNHVLVLNIDMAVITYSTCSTHTTRTLTHAYCFNIDFKIISM